MRTLLLASLLVLLGSAPASAIDIEIVFDPGGVDPCDPDENYPTCEGGMDQTPEAHAIVEAAAAYWEDVIEDPGQIEIVWRWNVGAPSADVEVENGRPVSGTLHLAADRNYYYDPEPDVHDEYQDGNEVGMVPRFYADVLPEEQAEGFDGVAPGVFEVGFNGRLIFILQNRDDLMTMVLHELGHIVGLGPGIHSFEPACDPPNDPFYAIDPADVGGFDFAIKAYESPNQVFDCNHLALGGITACEDQGLSEGGEERCKAHQAMMYIDQLSGPRGARPSVADLLVIKRAADWQLVDLPRKHAVVEGHWDDASTWIGNRVPDADDDVYVRLEGAAINALAPATGRDLFLDSSDLDLLFGGSFRDIRIEGNSTLVCDLGSDCSSADVEIGNKNAGGNGGILDVAFGSTFDADEIAVTSDGELRGAGTLDVDVLRNAGRIRANNGTLTIESSSFDPPFTMTQGSVEAVSGNVIFDGAFTGVVRGSVLVSSGRTVAFTQGWTFDGYRILMEGRPNQATVAGVTNVGNAILDPEGTARFTSLLRLLPDAELEMELAGSTPGSQHDRLDVVGGLFLGGTLELALDDGFVPQEGDVFTIITAAGGVMDTFDSVTGLDIGGGLEFEVLYFENDVRLAVNVIGDFDGNGGLGLGDAVILLSSFGVCQGACETDLSGDGLVGVLDLFLWILLFFGLAV